MALSKVWRHRALGTEITIVNRTGSFAQVKCCRSGKIWFQAINYIWENYV